MKDIAAALNVSVATVSRALADNPSISEGRRKVIQEYAKEHHFVSNAIAESLRNSRTKPQRIIGVIVPEIVHFFFASVISGIEEEASRRGYFCIIAQSKEDYEREMRICEEFLCARVCGIIVSQAKTTRIYDHFRRLQENEMPLVFYDRICTGINAPRVVVDDYHGAYTATKFLIDTGCRRIAFCGKPMNLEIVKNRLNGYRDALLQNNIGIDDSLILECDNRALAEECIPEVLGRENAPDGFFCINDDTAIGIVHMAKRMGLRIPEDVSICGFTNGQRAIACDPMLTTMDQRGEQLGREATDILLNMVEGKTPLDKIEKRIVRSQLVVRETTRQLTVNNDYAGNSSCLGKRHSRANS